MSVPNGRSDSLASTGALTPALTDFSLNSRWENFSAPVRREAHRAMLNIVGCALGGSSHRLVDSYLRQIAPYTGGVQASVIGRVETLDLVNAALLNCASAAVHAYDDTHLKTILHPSGPVAAVALALAQVRRASGRELLTALVVGMEVEIRVGMALIGEQGDGLATGWYTTGISGGIGAAIAAGRLMQLDERQMGWAIGHAAGQAFGFRATHASDAAALVPGWAARNGVTAAFLAQAGLNCRTDVIEGRHGLFEVMAPGMHAITILDGLGEKFEFLDNAYKPFPAGIVLHAAIDACLTIAHTHDLEPQAIARIELEVHPVAFALARDQAPTNAAEAQVSPAYWAAVTLVSCAAGIEQTMQPWLSDVRVMTLARCVGITADASLARDQARARVYLKSGEILRCEIAHASGSRDRPLSDDALARKYHDQADPVLGKQNALSARIMLGELENLGDVVDLMTLLCPKAGRS